jgi:hypothetical protein
MSEVANSFKVIGLLKRVFPTERKSDKFQCREFVIEIAAKYPEFIKFQLTQDRCDLIDAYTEGADKIEVSFNVTGREWQGKYFTTLNAWKIKKVGEAQVAVQEQETPIVSNPIVLFGSVNVLPPPISLPSEPLKAADTDDLPF